MEGIKDYRVGIRNTLHRADTGHQTTIVLGAVDEAHLALLVLREAEVYKVYSVLIHQSHLSGLLALNQ